MRPSTHYSSYVKTRSRRQSATSVHYFSDHSDESIVGIPAEIMKQIKYEEYSKFWPSKLLILKFLTFELSTFDFWTFEGFLKNF